MPELSRDSYKAELEAILGTEYNGVLSSDDYSVYNGYNVKAQQKCLAHLRRHFLRLVKLRHSTCKRSPSA